MSHSDMTLFADITADLEIPNEGILSKVLYRDAQSRVVGFGFDTDQELSEHTAAVPVIVQVISGRFGFTVGEETTEIGPSSWVHLEASVPHSVVAREPSRLLLTMLP